VEKHLQSIRRLADKKDADDISTIYRLLGKRLTQLAQKKHPETDFSEIINLLG
jgi:hypothetical protein